MYLFEHFKFDFNFTTHLGMSKIILIKCNIVL